MIYNYDTGLLMELYERENPHKCISIILRKPRMQNGDSQNHTYASVFVLFCSKFVFCFLNYKGIYVSASVVINTLKFQSFFLRSQLPPAPPLSSLPTPDY